MGLARRRITREEWLHRATDELRPRFAAAGLTIPADLGLSCGWPSSGGTSRSNRIEGECWHASTSTGARTEIFISPTLDDGVKVADCLAHELIHACGYHSHRPDFARAARSVGLVGKPTQAYAGPELLAELKRLVRRIGRYPHTRIRA